MKIKMFLLLAMIAFVGSLFFYCFKKIILDDNVSSSRKLNKNCFYTLLIFIFILIATWKFDNLYDFLDSVYMSKIKPPYIEFVKVEGGTFKMGSNELDSLLNET